MKKALTSLCVLLCLSTFGQTIAIFTSAGTSHHFDLESNDDFRKWVKYAWRSAYSFGASYRYPLDEEVNLKVALSLRHTNGSYSRGGGSLAGRYSRDVSFSKTSLGLAAYSLSSSMEKRVQFQFGVAMEILLGTHLRGKSVGSIGSQVWDLDTSDFDPWRLALGVEWGLRTKLMNMGKHRLELLTDLYLGVLDDIDNNVVTHSLRISTGLSFVLGGSTAIIPSPASS